MIRLIFIFLPLLGCSQNDLLENQWLGNTEYLGQTYTTQIRSKSDTLLLRFANEKTYENFECAHVAQRQQQVEFDFSWHGEEWKFKGTINEKDQLKGHFEVNGLLANSLLHRRLDLAPSDWKPFLGNYKLPSGGILRIWEEGDYLRFHSPISRQEGLLRKIGESHFFSTTGEQLKFLPKGQFPPNNVQWIAPSGQELMGEKVAEFRVENHLIVTSSDTIGASLYLPAKQGRHPACINVRGAARMERGINQLEAEFFASYGIATLIYDNFGTGQSSGNLGRKDFEDKQTLNIEIFGWLQKHPEINSQKIGLRGGSQGGRIALMAASELPETAFLILASTPFETRMDQQVYALSEYNRQQGFSEVTIAEAGELWRQFFIHAFNQTNEDRFIQAVENLRAEYPGLALPEVNKDTPPSYPWPDDIYSNTQDYIPGVKCPVLALFGSYDDRIPAQKSAAQLERGLVKNGNKNLQIIVYEGSNHSFMLPGYRIVAGFLMDQIYWMKKVLD